MSHPLPILESHNLMVGYNTPCTHPITFTISTPGIYALSGPNGSGKSTFLKTIVSLLNPISGRFCTNKSLKISYVPQVHSVNQFFHLSMYNFIVQGYGPKYKATQASKAFIQEHVKIWQLEKYLDKCFHELSGGQKTQAMIIRALISNPNLLFLDEPLASLDQCCQKLLISILQKLVLEKNVCIFLADHHIEHDKSLLKGELIFEKKHNDPLTHVSLKLHNK